MTLKALCRAFTLMEILISVAIICILAALLLPTLARTKQRSLDAQCITKLAQLGHAIVLYSVDYDDYPPPGGAGEGGSDDVKARLIPYGCMGEVWRCPRDTWYAAVIDGEFKFEYSSNFDKFGSSYVYDGRSAKLGMSLTSGQSPAETLLAADAFPYHSEIGDPDGLFNVLFRDLHVKGTRWSKRESTLWPDFR